MLDRRVESLILKRLISEADGDTNRSDHNSAIALARTLTFPSMEEWNTKLSPIASSRKLSDTTRVRECSNISKDSEVFAEKTDAIFTRLRTLCRLASSPTFSANVSVMDNAIYSDQVYLVAKEITSITNTPITSKNTAHHYVVLHCSAHHCRKVSPWWELHSSIMTQTLSRLRSSIEGVRLDIPEENQESIDTKAIIRALSVGVIASVERPVGLWFHQYVTELSNRLGLKRLDELRCILEDVLWPDGWNLPDIELRDGEETQIVEQGIKRTGR